MNIHLDPLGGWSGDMFVAAMLGAFPDLWPAVEAAVASLDLGPGADCSLVQHGDGTLTGRRFLVAAETPSKAHSRHDHDVHHHDRHHHHDQHHHHGDHRHTDEARPHGHRSWSGIREMLAHSKLDRVTKQHAIGIFRLLAEAEAEVHGVAEDDVSFHEVGAVDSIVDIVASAEIIARLGAVAWSSSPLPLGSGRIRTQHGLLPVPAPATALLLRGLSTIDDGIPGERVTPTGAAVARYLLSGERPAPKPRRLVATGTGFGARVLPGISNCLRVLVFEPDIATSPVVPAAFTHRELGVITFEVDDQSAEDLANGLDRIRALPGVHDVIQSVAFGKKGRMATQVQVLAAPATLEGTIAACFVETTTIGLRFDVVQGAALRRVAEEVDIDGRSLRVKLVQRPDGSVTAKTEASDVAGDTDHAARVRLRRQAEDLAMQADPHRFKTRPGEHE